MTSDDRQSSSPEDGAGDARGDVSIPKSLAIVIEVDLSQSRAGLDARLHETIADESVLRRTVEGCRLAAERQQTSVGRTWLLVRERDRERVAELVRGCDVDWFVHDFDDIPARSRLRRARKWGRYGWRGGIGDSYFVCEAINPRAAHALYHANGWSVALWVPAEAAVVDPALIDGIAAHYLQERYGAPCYLSTAAPGLAADVLHVDLVDSLAASACSIDRVYPFRPDLPSCDPDLRRIAHPFDEAVTNHRGRYLADSRHGLALLRELWNGEGSTPRRPLAREIRDLIARHPEWQAGVVPEEIIIEVDAESKVADARWSALAVAAAERDDLLITIRGRGGGRSSDPCEWADLATRVAEMRQAGAHGIHIETHAAGIDAVRASEWLAMPIDAITVNLLAPNADCYERLDPFARSTGDAGEAPAHFDARLRGFEALVEAVEERRDGDVAVPFLAVSLWFEQRVATHLDAFFDAWFDRVDRILIRGYEAPDGREAADAMGCFAPPTRFPCVRLVSQMAIAVDGRVPMCVRDPEYRGDAGALDSEHGVRGLWQGARFREWRELHADGNWQQCHHCGSCRSWFRLD